ncbi:hypothetical protein VNO77_08876 [Canavalia gladiata]|uniref:Uncharacterized protein n=1 Tax=Canavalia gladiata TaxID=3824 RepID=A0AAN9M8S5_CANGL
MFDTTALQIKEVLETAVLDLVADDGAGIQKQRSIYHWDKIKTESGAKTRATKTGIYIRSGKNAHTVRYLLKGQTMMAILKNQQDLTEDVVGILTAAFNAHVRSEIKDMDQIRKERQKKANRISYIKNKSTKGKKFGRKGKKVCHENPCGNLASKKEFL